jgi:uncharacterized protein YndB with AHSA1/START domain
MGPFSFMYSARIPTPIDKVFALISDPARMPEWLPRCVAVQTTTSDRVGKGARFKVTFQRETSRHEAVIEIIDFSPPHTKTLFGLGWEGGSTKVSLKHVWQPSGFRSWLNGRFYRRRNARRMCEGLINDLRKALTR